MHILFIKFSKKNTEQSQSFLYWQLINHKSSSMKTKKDFWRTMIGAYLLIFLGILILFIVDEDNPFEIYFLLGAIVTEVSSIFIILRALRIYRSLEDKSIYPKQLDFLNRLAIKLYSDKKTSNKVISIALIFGALIGVLIGFNLQEFKSS